MGNKPTKLGGTTLNDLNPSTGVLWGVHPWRRSHLGSTWLVVIQLLDWTVGHITGILFFLLDIHFLVEKHPIFERLRILLEIFVIFGWWNPILWRLCYVKSGFLIRMCHGQVLEGMTISQPTLPCNLTHVILMEADGRYFFWVKCGLFCWKKLVAHGWNISHLLEIQ